MTKQNLARRLLPLALLALASCISLPSSGDKHKEPLSIYTLHPAVPAKGATSQSKTSAVVVVPKPEVPTGFMTERIALYFEQSHRLDYYANAAWSGRLDSLLQEFFIQTAQSGLPGKVVAAPERATGARYKLTVKITDFQPVYQDTPDSPPRLDVALTVTVTTVPEEKVRTQFTLNKSALAGANTLTSVTKGLEELLQSITEEALKKAAPHMTEP